MKLGRVALVLLALIACLGLATAVSAAPASPKEEYSVVWINMRDGDPWDDEWTAGQSWHARSGSVVFDLTECTNPKVCGTLEWWAHSYMWNPQTEGVQVTWRIDVPGRGYWEGTGTNVNRSADFAQYEKIARWVGHGHGEFEGWLLKGEHWYESGEPTPCDGCDNKVFLAGEINKIGRE
jgi:hypothetical protein